MAVKETRVIIVNGLNDMLDVDYELVQEAFTREIDLKPDSMLLNSPLAYDKKGVKVMTALSLVSAVLGERIEPVFEDGVIQRFE
jgi:hypothetical protein